MDNCPEATTKPDLTLVVNEVLGNLAFLIGEDEPPPDLPTTDWLQFEISYRGPFDGTLRCWCTPVLAQQMAANLLGADPLPEEAAAAAEDACREFINVLCGQVVTTCYGRQAVFTLTIPQVVRGPQASPPENLGEEFCRVQVSGEPMYCQHLRQGRS